MNNDTSEMASVSAGDKVKEDPCAADLQWSLFIAALQSYRFDTVLRPFPSAFVRENGDKDVKYLEKVTNHINKLDNLMNEEQKSIVSWALDSKSFSVSTLDKSQFNEIRKKTGDTGEVTQPDFIFEITPSEAANSKFEEIQQGRQLLYAYHGSRLENFHSILHNGLASHMNKTSVFGEGTYLCSELSVSLLYSPTGLGWEKSKLGKKLSCVAVCEMIDDPAVKCQVKTEEQNGFNRNRARAGNSMAGDVPDKYYIVQNNDVIRVKYLLVYAEKHSPHRSRNSWHTTWLYQQRFGLMMIFYALILLLVGLYNSKTFQFQLRKWFKYR